MLSDLRALNGGAQSAEDKPETITPVVFSLVQNESETERTLVEIHEEPDEATVSAFFQKDHEQEEATVGAFDKGNRPTPVDSKRKRTGLYAAVGSVAALCIIVLSIIFLPRLTKDNAEGSADQTSPHPIEISDEQPFQKDWSAWGDSLPEYVTEESYDIEERVLYSGSELEYTSSTTTEELDGWELYDVADGAGSFGPWSEWSKTVAVASENREVEQVLHYRYSEKETTTSNSNLDGWTLYNTTYTTGDFGAWSNWSGSYVEPTANREVQSKTQYSYREITYTTEYSDWSSWSAWSSTAYESNDTTKVESRTVYGYYYFQCPGCGAHMHCWDVTCPTWAGGCGRTYIPEESFRVLWSTTPYNSVSFSDWYGTGRGYAYVDGVLVFNWGLHTSTQYRYCTRTPEQVAHYGSWSGWSDSRVDPTASIEVQTRDLYRYRDREQIPVYHYYRWSNWSAWQNEKVTESDSRRVETETLYRYRDRATEKTYYFRKWGEWSEFSEEELSDSESLRVRTKTEYRYKSKNT